MAYHFLVVYSKQNYIMNFKYCFWFFVVSCFTLNEIISLSTKQDVESNSIKKINEMCTKYMAYRYTNLTLANSPEQEPISVSKIDCLRAEPLISDRKVSQPKEFPHMALIGFGETQEDIQWLCDGSLISEQFVLSAAHCNHASLRDVPKWVHLGKTDLRSTNKESEDPRDYEVVAIYEHPNYNQRKSYHDIALYKLNETVLFNAFVRPLCLYPYGTLDYDKVPAAIMTRWGVDYIGDQAEVLQKANVQFVQTKKCEEIFDKKVEKFSDGFKSKFQLCASGSKNGSDTCLGNFGGPLQIEIPNETCMFYQIGISSIRRLDCVDKNHLAVYTNVGMYLNWIQGIVWPN